MVTRLLCGEDGRTAFLGRTSFVLEVDQQISSRDLKWNRVCHFVVSQQISFPVLSSVNTVVAAVRSWFLHKIRMVQKGNLEQPFHTLQGLNEKRLFDSIM